MLEVALASGSEWGQVITATLGGRDFSRAGFKCADKFHVLSALHRLKSFLT